MREGANKILAALGGGGVHVLPVHAEVEGGIMADNFLALLDSIKRMDYRFLRLGDMAALLERSQLPVRRFRLELLPGRSVACAV
jgi:hypothetical protein